MPSNIVHNPRHKAGKAGGRYNRQAFMFRRGKHFYRRAYYLGPDGGAYFYDEDIPGGDPSMGAMTSGLPTCPVDADDCQGFADPIAAAPAVDSRVEALQLIQSVQPGCSFDIQGAVHANPEYPSLVAYGDLIVELWKENWAHHENLSVSGLSKDHIVTIAH